jgi:hypothetical protein
MASSSVPTSGWNIHSARTTPHLAGNSSGSIGVSVVSFNNCQADRRQIARQVTEQADELERRTKLGR